MKDEEEFGIDYKELDGFQIRREQWIKTLWGPKSEKPIFKVGMREQEGKLARAAKLIAQGEKGAKIVKMVGLGISTVFKLKKVLRVHYGIEGVCRCGKKGGHEGVCRLIEVKLCEVNNCPRETHAYGLCTYHYHKKYHKNMLKECVKRSNEKRRDNITDGYIKHLICESVRVPYRKFASKIPKQLILAKRGQLIAVRQIKESHENAR